MKTTPSASPSFAAFLALVLAVASLGSFVAPATAQTGTQLLWSTPWSNYTIVPSRTWTSPASDLEAADDFDVQGAITRVVFDAFGCFQCAQPTITGATVRFYAWVNGNPGALLHTAHVAAGAPGLLYYVPIPATVDVTLPTPFLATGKHFVSMQVHFQGSGYWDIWSSSVGAPQLSPVRVRDNLAGGQWTHATLGSWTTSPLHADITFQLFGQPAGSSGTQPIPCVTWSELPTSMTPTATHSLLRAVKAFSPSDAWAVGHSTEPSGVGGYDQLTRVLRWDGTSWTQIPSPSPGPAAGLVNVTLYALDGASTNDLWAAGNYVRQVPGGWVGSQVFAMHWDGVQWTVPASLPIPATSTGAGVAGSTVYDVHAQAANDVWLVGDWLDVVSASSGQTTRPGLLLRWDGTTLQQTLLPIVTGVGHQWFKSVSATGPNDVWVAGGAGGLGSAPGSSVPVLFRFDGTSWTHTLCAVPSHPGWRVSLQEVTALAPNDVYVYGISSTSTPTQQSDPFLSHWNGAAWNLLPSPPAGVSTIDVVSATEAWAVGSAIWRFDGVAWTQTEAFTAQFGAALSAVDTIGACGAFAVGGQQRIGQVSPFAMRLDASTWAGTGVRLPSNPDLAPATLVPIGSPLIGSTLLAAIDDPTGGLGVPSGFAIWLFAAAPAPGFPAGTVVPIGGRNGGPGELFVDLATTGHITPFAPWNAGGPVTVGVPVPANPAFLGADVHTQAAVLDLTGPLRLVFSNGLDLHFGQ